MAFEAKRYDSGKAKTMKTEASTTIKKWDALVVNASGFVQRAVAGTTYVPYVALEDVTTGAGENKEILVVATREVEFEADTNGNTSQAVVGVKADLTDHDTVNEAASVNDVFEIIGVIGAAAAKKVKGFFVQK